MAKQATKQMTIGEIIELDENIAQILMRNGMHCLGCMMASTEDLEQACGVHGIDADKLIEEINTHLALGVV